MNPKLANEKDCVGCGACAQICPKGAITMTEDELGFLHPKLNENLCIKCGLCEKVCHDVMSVEEKEIAKHFYTYEGNDEVRLLSSSGGFFTLCAEYAINNGYSVCGAIFDDNFHSVKLTLANTADELSPMRKSKYIATNTQDVYKKIGCILKNDKKILFFGLPCQVSGLLSYLKNAKLSTKNLITVDFLCHGVGSPKIWRMNLCDFANENKISSQEIKTIDFRPKPEHSGRSILIATDKFSCLSSSKDFPYYYGFENRFLLRESCYGCSFRNEERVSDITIGDMVPSDSNGKGKSLVLINTSKGEIFANLFDFSACGVKMSDDEIFLTKKRLSPTNEKIHKYRNKMKISTPLQFKKLKSTYLNKNWSPWKYKLKRKLFKLIKKSK